MTTYQLYTIQCNSNTAVCQPLLEVHGIITADHEVQSSDIIKVDATINAPAILTLRSANLIELLPDFEMQDGASLRATIETCDTN